MVVLVLSICAGLDGCGQSRRRTDSQAGSQAVRQTGRQTDRQKKGSKPEERSERFQTQTVVSKQAARRVPTLSCLY